MIEIYYKNGYKNGDVKQFEYKGHLLNNGVL